MTEYTEEQRQLMEENLTYNSYKRNIKNISGEEIERELGGMIPDGVTLEMHCDYLRKTVNYYLQKDIYMLNNNKFDMTGYKKTKETNDGWL